MTPGDGRIIICCDCGLAHTYFYSLKKVRGKLKIAILGFRDDYETELARKKRERNSKGKS